MSLVGNLEDLGLGEILQIVSLSRKSGVLQLNSRDRDGRIIFRDGQVIRAISSNLPENLGDLVLRSGLADMSTLKKALAFQQENSPGQRIGDILVDHFGANRDAIETAVREQVEKVVFSFFAWDEGSFSFELGDPEELATTNLDPLQFMLDQGLNPQWLALEGNRILDEMRHSGEFVEERGESKVDGTSLPQESASKMSDPFSSPKEISSQEPLKPGHDQQSSFDKQFLIYDRDPITAQQFAEMFQERLVAVHVVTDERSFIAALGQADPTSTVLVLDLSEPGQNDIDDSTGYKLLKNIRFRLPEFQTLVISNSPSQQVEQHVRQFGVTTFLTKPQNNGLGKEHGLVKLKALVDDILAIGLVGQPDRSHQELYNIGVELREEFDEVAETEPLSTASPGLHLLRGMLQELNNPTLGGGISLLILRFASELMNRAVILLVKEETIVGLGQFGIELTEDSPDARVRHTQLPKAENHIFKEALSNFSTYHVKPLDTEWNQYFFDQLGGGVPTEVFIGPLISEGRVVAVLYGDNLPENKPIGDTETLEIFLSQAGLAMEKALLERRMMSQTDV